jgi:hypothetical protein
VMDEVHPICRRSKNVFGSACRTRP